MAFPHLLLGDALGYSCKPSICGITHESRHLRTGLIHRDAPPSMGGKSSNGLPAISTIRIAIWGIYICIYIYIDMYIYI